MKKLLCAILLMGVTAMFFTGCHSGDGELIITYSSGDIMLASDITEIIRRSENLVRADILDERTEIYETRRTLPSGRTEEQRGIFTVYNIRVTEVFMGDLEVGTIMEIRQRGGQVGNEVYVNRYMNFISPGDDLVLFAAGIALPEDHPAYGLPAVLPPNGQGVYRFPSSPALGASAEGASVSRMSADVALESVEHSFTQGRDAIVRNHFELTLTVGDLQRLAEESRRGAAAE